MLLTPAQTYDPNAQERSEQCREEQCHAREPERMAGGEAIECRAEVADDGDIERRQQYTGGKPNWVASNVNVDLFGLNGGDRTEIRTWRFLPFMARGARRTILGTRVPKQAMRCLRGLGNPGGSFWGVSCTQKQSVG